MTFRLLRALAFAVLLLAGPSARAAEPLLLGGDERILVLAPHPDDETLFAGGLVQEALALDVPVRVCFLTMGDNNEISFLFTRKHPVIFPGAVRAMGTLRMHEAIAASTQLGLATNDLVFLGYPDAGTLAIWNGHWREVPPYRSKLTRVNAVPYERALTPGSAYAGEDILDDLDEVLRDFRPTHVVVPHPADHNVDHRALYLFARVALWNLAAEFPAPELLPAPLHFTQWPEPRRYHPLRSASPPHFLADSVAWREFALAPFQVSNKLAAIRRHHTQYRWSAPYLDSFIRKSELFGDFPDIVLPPAGAAVDLPEEDASQFRPDETLFDELAERSAGLEAIADQIRSESRALGDDDNDFVARGIRADDTHLTLVLSFQFRKRLLRDVVLSVALHGYRFGVPFGEMPKIAIETTADRIRSIRDLQTDLPPDAVELLPGSHENEVVLRVPLALLGDPEKILTSAQLSSGQLPIDWVAWRVVDLVPGAAAPPPARPAPFADESASEPAPEPEPAAAPAPAEEPLPPQKANALTPRVPLPRKSIPAHTEASEPVFW